MLSLELDDVFADGGPLAEAASRYHLRQGQLELARSIAKAIDQHETLIAEAGTGTGKTWAYLVPVFLSGAKALISTGTRTLQDQLFHRDLPHIRKALKLPLQTALLKGRSNYVCHYHLERAEVDLPAFGFSSRTDIMRLRDIRLFADRSQTGDKAELSDIPEEAGIWSRVTSTRENCLGQECPFINDCFVLKARRRAQEADIVVVNHALFMADLALREEGITDLLPEVDTVVFDEAHQLPDVATRFLGTVISLHQIMDLAQQIEAAGLAHARGVVPDWGAVSGKIDTACKALRLSTIELGKQAGGRATFDAIPNAEAFDSALEDLLETLDRAIKILELIAEKHPDLDAAYKLAIRLRATLFLWSQPDRQGRHALMPDKTAEELKAESAEEVVRWIEATTHSLRFHSAPLSVAKIFSRYRQPHQAWVLTSATLSVYGNFAHFVHQLGLWEARTEVWPSPFDYPNQGLLLVPNQLPVPSAPQFNEAFVELLVPLIQKTPGGVLVLCTTLRAVDRIADLLEEAFEEFSIQRPLLRQGERSRRVLLEAFQQSHNTVLVGSASFWEGIDVPGDALTLVAIDKLPFAPPDDPVLEARIKACRERGGNPFMEYQLPDAAIALKQGAGRLIRTEQDWGVLVVGDSRIVDKHYGKLLWRGLPAFTRTRDPQRAAQFFEERKLTATSTTKTKTAVR
ncbi:MAG TPA: ATP-dependent DNA helicase [Candidatus Paenalcaligenes intestinipullorum]|uniref:ATP-dependent DNA helicase n=1 Tax=Candidatus Paenalcaligenes intestinipullorum TaxID=2838718 RepID=A0A9D2U8M2_9BURK|nr:ATP-dependent DNA helicase [Candidatus Paenalcaligenes intestinipullorum]